MLKNGKVNAYQYGTTVRLECAFYDFDDVKINPDSVKIIIYNARYEILIEQTLVIDGQKNIGEFFYDYITESKKQTIYYEWYGEINGKPSLKRGEFTTKFI